MASPKVWDGEGMVCFILTRPSANLWSLLKWSIKGWFLAESLPSYLIPISFLVSYLPSLSFSSKKYPVSLIYLLTPSKPQTKSRCQRAFGYSPSVISSRPSSICFLQFLQRLFLHIPCIPPSHHRMDK